MKFLYVAGGGAIGALMRYGVLIISQSFFGMKFPFATLFVNIAGSFIIGFLYKTFEHITPFENIKLLIFVGILGSFTTFSAFSLENFSLFRSGNYIAFSVNIFASVMLALSMVFAGYHLAKLCFVFK